MRTVEYEVYEGPQTVTVISPNSSPARGSRYITLAAEDPALRSRTYIVNSPDELPSKISRYVYDAPYGSQIIYPTQQKTIDRKFAIRSDSPVRGRSGKRSIEVVTEKKSSSRAPSPHPRGILRQSISGVERDQEGQTIKTSTVSTIATVGATAALSKVTSTKTRKLSSSSSSSEGSITSLSSTSSTRSDFSSYARTSSRTGTFYFAYGPHISPSQLKRHVHHSSSSTRPVALVRLHNFTWYISSRGVANLASCPPPETQPAETDADIVWGLLYNLDADSESDLDTHFSWDALEARPSNTQGKSQTRPWLQCNNKTNKLFPTVEVAEWFIGPSHFGTDTDTIRAMTYIDEIDTTPGRIRNEYITSMSEAIATAIGYGIPRGWIDNVMRMYGIKPRRAKTNNTVLDIKVEEDKSEDESVRIDESVTTSTVRRRRSRDRSR